MMNPQDSPPTPRNQAQDKNVKLASRLRRKAQAIVEKQSTQLWDSSPRSLIARQLALTLEELQQMKEVNRRVHLGLLRAECEIDTALLQPTDNGDRPRLQAQLFKLQQHRRELALQEHQHLSDLSRRILELVNRWVHVSGEDDRG